MKKSLFNKSAVALAAGLFAACAANAYVVGVAGGINGVPEATVLNINPNGLGHQLFVPYYTAQDGNRTYLTLVNTDMRNGKAVKIRFRGASNSDDVLDFTVFLSPGDAWTAVVSAATNSNPARLEVVEGDNSCTAPAIPAGGQEFRTFRLHPQLTPDLIARETREGYIEIFNEADIPPTVAAIPAGSTAPTLYRAIEHSAAGVPLNCDAIRSTSTTALARVTPVANAQSTYNAGAGTHSIQDMAQIGENYAQAQARGFEMPTTGLMASWAIANPSNGRSWSGNAVAVQAEAVVGGVLVPGTGNIVYHPQRGDHTDAELPIATVRERTADPLLRGGGTSNNVAPTATLTDPNPQVQIIPQFQDPAVANMVPIRALSVDLPDMSTPYLFSQIGANGSGPRIQAQRLSAALANRSVSNEILTLGSGRTDWSFTFPTRRYNVARAYATGANESAGSTRYTDYRVDDTGATIVGGRNYFSPVNVVSENSIGRRHQLCVNGISNQNGAKGGPEGTGAGNSGNRVNGVTANREESFLAGGSGGIDFSPAPPPGTTAAFCGEAGVFSFNRTGEPTGVLNAAVAIRNFNTSGRNFGWSRFTTLGLENVAADATAQPAASITGAVAGLGLPVVGFAFWTFENLSIALPHRRN